MGELLFLFGNRAVERVELLACFGVGLLCGVHGAHRCCAFREEGAHRVCRLGRRRGHIAFGALPMLGGGGAFLAVRGRLDPFVTDDVARVGAMDLCWAGLQPGRHAARRGGVAACRLVLFGSVFGCAPCVARCVFGAGGDVVKGGGVRRRQGVGGYAGFLQLPIVFS